MFLIEILGCQSCGTVGSTRVHDIRKSCTLTKLEALNCSCVKKNTLAKIYI